MFISNFVALEVKNRLFIYNLIKQIVSDGTCITNYFILKVRIRIYIKRDHTTFATVSSKFILHEFAFLDSSMKFKKLYPIFYIDDWIQFSITLFTCFNLFSEFNHAVNGSVKISNRVFQCLVCFNVHMSNFSGFCWDEFFADL